MEPTKIQISSKQAEYVREAHHRWNIAVGAVRSGKSHIAIQYAIPNGLMERTHKKGINLILGVSRETIERNVLRPMRDMWGDKFVGEINGRNIAVLFGEQCYCIGVDDRGQVSKIQGSEVKFCYVDEICRMHREVFEMLKSRMSLPYSQCHAACNPEGPRHFVKKFIDEAEERGVDLWCQKYTLYDNPYLPKEYVRSIEAEYRGTVYYKRFVLGEWSQAEGLVWPMWEECIEDEWEGNAAKWYVSMDYGTRNATAALKWAYDGKVWHCVDEYYYSGRDTGRQKTDQDYVDDMQTFTSDMPTSTCFIIDPSAASFIAAMNRRKMKTRKADNAVADGIRDVATAMRGGQIKISSKCKSLIEELQGYVWDEDDKGEDKPVKVNDHACDALRYFVRTMHVVRKRDEYKSPF